MQHESSPINCSVIEDLLPLYLDGACSKQSCELVEVHLVACEECRQLLDQMKVDIKLPLMPEVASVQEVRNFQSLGNAWKKTKIYAWLKGALITTIFFSLLISAYFGLTQWYVIPIKAEDVIISDLVQLSDGSISYRLNTKDGYPIHYMTHNYYKNETYTIGYRSIIKEKPLSIQGKLIRFNPNEQSVWKINVMRKDNQSHVELINEMSDTYTVYYGSEEDSLLIWETGIKLPKAKEEIEQYWLGDKIVR